MQDRIAEKILFEIEEEQWSLLLGSPESELWLEQMGAAALLELQAELASSLTERQPMNYLEPITLTGQHIRLEPLHPPLHAPPMFQHFEPRVMDFMGRGSEMQTAAQLEAHLESLNAISGRINWAVVIVSSGAVAGRISYSETKPDDRWLEVGTLLMPAFWGGAANPESKLLLMTRAFEVLGVNRVQFKVDSRNERSMAAMVKLGAVREGVLRDCLVRSDGYVRSSVVCSVLRAEWPAVKATLEARVRKV